MADVSSKTQSRLTQVTDLLTGNETASAIPWNPNSTKFPSRKEVPRREGKLDGCNRILPSME